MMFTLLNLLAFGLWLLYWLVQRSAGTQPLAWVVLATGAVCEIAALAVWWRERK
jgi:hypothetical protein